MPHFHEPICFRARDIRAVEKSHSKADVRLGARKAFGRARVPVERDPDGNQVDMTVFKKEIDAGAPAMREAMKTVTPFAGRPNPPLTSQD